MLLGLNLIPQTELEQTRKRSNEAEIKHTRVVHDVNIVIFMLSKLKKLKKFLA